MLLGVQGGARLNALPDVLSEQLGLGLDLLVVLADEQLYDGQKIVVAAAEILSNQNVGGEFLVTEIYVGGGQAHAEIQVEFVNKFVGETEHEDTVDLVGVGGDGEGREGSDQSRLGVSVAQGAGDEIDAHIRMESTAKGGVDAIAEGVVFFVGEFDVGLV